MRILTRFVQLISGNKSPALALGAKLLAICGAAGLVGASSHVAVNLIDNPVVGIWTTLSLSEITIEPCATGYCGFITKIVVPQHIRDKYGDDVIAQQGNFLDALNEDPALRGRPIHGLQILALQHEFRAGKLNGRIYNPEDGKTYEGYMEIVDFNSVRLSGCVLFNLICMGEDWTRAPALLPENSTG